MTSIGLFTIRLTQRLEGLVIPCPAARAILEEELSKWKQEILAEAAEKAEIERKFWATSVDTKPMLNMTYESLAAACKRIKNDIENI